MKAGPLSCKADPNERITLSFGSDMHAGIPETNRCNQDSRAQVVIGRVCFRGSV